LIFFKKVFCIFRLESQILNNQVKVITFLYFWKKKNFYSIFLYIWFVTVYNTLNKLVIFLSFVQVPHSPSYTFACFFVETLICHLSFKIVEVFALGSPLLFWWHWGLNPQTSSSGTPPAWPFGFGKKETHCTVGIEGDMQKRYGVVGEVVVGRVAEEDRNQFSRLLWHHP
jgi:hypothetical protein